MIIIIIIITTFGNSIGSGGFVTMSDDDSHDDGNDLNDDLNADDDVDKPGISTVKPT